jgi:myo-inositol-1(or 4)-monophosphatase
MLFLKNYLAVKLGTFYYIPPVNKNMGESLKIPNHGFSLGEDMAIAMLAAKEAGLIMINGYDKLQTVEEKGIGDLVSKVDRDCDAAIQSKLHGMLPNDDVLSEELAHDTKEKGQRLWVVDPLDATAAYLFRAGKDIPSVMIALRENFRTRLSVILFPLTGEWFYAKEGEGEGAFKDGQRITTEGVTKNLKEAWVETNHYRDISFETPAFAELCKKLRSPQGPREVRSLMPSAGGIIARIIDQQKKIAAIIHDNNPDRVKQAPWDIIPPQLLIKKAGGIMVNFKNEEVDPFKPEPYIAAGNEKIATAIVNLLAKQPF